MEVLKIESNFADMQRVSVITNRRSWGPPLQPPAQRPEEQAQLSPELELEEAQ